MPPWGKAAGGDIEKETSRKPFSEAGPLYIGIGAMVIFVCVAAAAALLDHGIEIVAVDGIVTLAPPQCAVSAPLGGRVSKVDVRNGDQVVEGQRLLTMEPPVYGLSLHEVDLMLAAGDARADRLKAELSDSSDVAFSPPRADLSEIEAEAARSSERLEFERHLRLRVEATDGAVENRRNEGAAGASARPQLQTGKVSEPTTSAGRPEERGRDTPEPDARPGGKRMARRPEVQAGLRSELVENAHRMGDLMLTKRLLAEAIVPRQFSAPCAGEVAALAIQAHQSVPAGSKLLTIQMSDVSSTVSAVVSKDESEGIVIGSHLEISSPTDNKSRHDRRPARVVAISSPNAGGAPRVASRRVVTVHLEDDDTGMDDPPLLVAGTDVTLLIPQKAQNFIGTLKGLLIHR